MNIYIFRYPTITYRADDCPQGMVGLSHRGRAW